MTAPETYGLSAQIAEAFTDVFGQLRAIVSSALPTRASPSDIRQRAQSLLQACGWKRAPDTPRLQFDVAKPPAIVMDENAATETNPWVDFDEVSSMATQQALRLEELHTSATNCLDAADYALQRLKLELSAVAPNLVAGLDMTPLPLNRAAVALAAPPIPHGRELATGIAA
ncbi:hypothetical protein [Candidatus Filomicrobium marinum]|uniref:hypothetical protein n=1 Tax=Candidatus Filomicrobium marinum TaxID=1608628 RepID=UPI001AEC5AA4|nr:hypothetical protein [Candidatus Filomicrobium marinum]